MTTYDLDTLTLGNIGEEASDENRLAYSALFLGAYNEAYQWLCANTLKPMAGKEVTLDADRQFSPTAQAMSVAPGGIVSVKPYRDFSTEADFTMAPEYEFYFLADGTVAVPGAPGLSRVYVTYCCLPPALENGTPTAAGSGTEPVWVPEPWQGALASYAAAAFFRVRRKFERMQVWLEQWQTAVQGLRGRADCSAARLRNVYTPMP